MCQITTEGFGATSTSTVPGALVVVGATTYTGAVEFGGANTFGDAKADAQTFKGSIAADSTQNPDIDFSGSSGFFKFPTGGVTNNLNLSGATPTYTAATPLINLGSWSTAMAVTPTANWAALQVNIASSGIGAYDAVAARFRTDTGAAGSQNLNCVQMRQTIAHNVAQSATVQASVNVSAAVAVGTGEMVVGYFSLDGTGAITLPGSNVASALVASVTNTGSPTGEMDVAYIRSAASTSLTSMVRVSNLGTCTNGILIDGNHVDGISITGTCSQSAVAIGAANKLQFRDTGLYLYSSANGQLDIYADATMHLDSPALEIDGDTTIEGTHKIQFFDTGLYVYSSANGVLDIVSDTTLNLTGPTTTITGVTKINLDGAVDLSGALVLDGATTTGITLNAAMTNGISITPTAATTCGILIGTSISAGMPMTSTKNGLIRAFGEIVTAEALTNDIRGIWSRVRVDANADLTGGYGVSGIQGTTKMYGSASGTTTTLWHHSGVYGSFESDGVSSANVASGGSIFGVMGALGLGNNFTISSGGIAAAVGALSNSNSGVTATGTFDGLYVGIATSSSGKAFTNGIEIQSASCTTGLKIGNTTTAISISGTGAAASSRAISAYYTVNNANYGDAYGLVESDLTLTGTVVGMVGGLCSWVNMASVTTGANMICAQQNGLWSDTGGVLTNGTFIFGMRAQCLLNVNGGASGAKFYPFCVVNNTNVTDAIFKCNAGVSDMGTTSVSKSSESKYVPLYEDDAGKHYVLIYN